MKEMDRNFYLFGDYRFDLESCVLFRNNQVVDLKPKALEILRVLVERGDEVVSKEELMERAWPDSFVEEANLSYHIHRLRRALAESTDEKFIETIPKRGYRFVKSLEKTSENGAPPSDGPDVEV